MICKDFLSAIVLHILSVDNCQILSFLYAPPLFETINFNFISAKKQTLEYIQEKLLAILLVDCSHNMDSK